MDLKAKTCQVFAQKRLFVLVFDAPT